MNGTYSRTSWFTWMATTTETGADAISIVTFCGRPLSKTRKSARCKPEIIRPSLEKTSVGTVTRRTGTWMVGICCAPSRAARLRATTAFPSRMRMTYCPAKPLADRDTGGGGGGGKAGDQGEHHDAQHVHDTAQGNKRLPGAVWCTRATLNIARRHDVPRRS